MDDGRRAERLRSAGIELARLVERVGVESAAEVEVIGSRCADAIGAGGKLLFAGNGGSAAQCQHLATELVCRLRADRRAYAAIALTTDTSFLTACANDYGFERVFARQIEALGEKGDVLIALSTGGRSPNVLAAVSAAREKGLTVVALTGENGTPLAQAADHAIVIPHGDSARIQELHLFIGHILCVEIESRLEAGSA